MLTINNLEEMQPYHHADSNTYIFAEDGERLDIAFTFPAHVRAHIHAGNIRAWSIDALNINARNIRAWNIDALNINAWDINAWNINAWNINAWDINARNINAERISYYAVCFAIHSFACTSITGRYKNARHFCNDGEIQYKPKHGTEAVT